MTTRATARTDLLSMLERLGFREGCIDLATIWPAVAAWMPEPASDVEPDGDERTFYVSHAPAGVDGTFAGAPPRQIAGVDLVCLELGREFNVLVRRGIPSVAHGLGSVGVTLWYSAGPSWEALRDVPGWIDLGPSTPNWDSFARADQVELFISMIRDSAIYDVASRQRPLAAEVFDSAEEHLVVLPAPDAFGASTE